MYLYQDTNVFFAQVSEDIKDIACEELRMLGAMNIEPVYRGIYFFADKEHLYIINYKSRLVSRILAPLIEFKCHSYDYLYRKALNINWKDFLSIEDKFAVYSTVSNSKLRHSKFAALRLKDAIADSFQREFGKRPSVDTREPDLWISLHVENNRAAISLDTSGGSLHRRGYRQKSVDAPMIETLAAAIIKFSGWDGNNKLYDPFCGSGTILCEAFMHATRTPAGILRNKYGFEKLPDFDPNLWSKVKREAAAEITEISNGIISGSDISNDAVNAASFNGSLIDKKGIINISKNDIFMIDNIENSTIICNPPYGIRSGRMEDISLLYKKLGDFLKQRCSGSAAYIYFGKREYIKNIGLRPAWKKILSNGGLDGRLVKYELY